MTTASTAERPGDAVTASTDEGTRSSLFEYLLRLGDDRLVLGHRLSEWCGHAPILEEDIALANIALDLIGEATLFLKLAAKTEGKGRDEDKLAYLREAIDYRNVLLVEFPPGDFAYTMVRQFLFSAAAVYQLEGLTRTTNTELAGIAAKALKETRYHVRHAGQWLIKLGDGTEESHRRAQEALDALWRFTGEMFLGDDVDRKLVQAGILPDLRSTEATWLAEVGDVINRATLTVPTAPYMHRGGRIGQHTEHLGHMLAEMQILQRSFPGAKW
jgi:ring-1,2-phenylacetyl-CoA epoxidase subunit PaaC